MSPYLLERKFYLEHHPDMQMQMKKLLSDVEIDFSAKNVWMSDGKIKNVYGTLHWLHRDVMCMQHVMTVILQDPADYSIAAAVSFRPVRLANGVTYLELVLVATAIKWQRKGVMQWLMADILKTFEAANINYVRVQAWKNRSAQHFFKKMGFHEVPNESAVMFPNFIFFGFDDVVHMECSFSSFYIHSLI